MKTLLAVSFGRKPHVQGRSLQVAMRHGNPEEAFVVDMVVLDVWFARPRCQMMGVLDRTRPFWHWLRQRPFRGDDGKGASNVAADFRGVEKETMYIPGEHQTRDHQWGLWWHLHGGGRFSDLLRWQRYPVDMFSFRQFFLGEAEVEVFPAVIDFQERKGGGGRFAAVFVGDVAELDKDAKVIESARQWGIALRRWEKQIVAVAKKRAHVTASVKVDRAKASRTNAKAKGDHDNEVDGIDMAEVVEPDAGDEEFWVCSSQCSGSSRVHRCSSRCTRFCGIHRCSSRCASSSFWRQWRVMWHPGCRIG